MATIKDIARVAGVSTMTVSRFFNEPEKLAKTTFDKVKTTVEETGYQPNMVARLLATRRTNIICIYIADDIDARHPFTLYAISAIGERLGKDGYSILLRRDSYEQVASDGIIAMGLNEEQEKRLMEISDQKAVIIFGSSRCKNNWVDIDNYKGSFHATEYMISRGYKVIGHIGVDNDLSYSQTRYKGYMDCMSRYGIEVPEGGVIKVANNEESGYDGAARVFEKCRPDALVCASDVLAMGALRYAKEHAISIPDDLGIIGFDGLGYEKMVSPNLTTIGQPVYAAGIALAERMIEVLRSGTYSGTEMMIEPVLMVGGTTK